MLDDTSPVVQPGSSSSTATNTSGTNPTQQQTPPAQPTSDVVETQIAEYDDTWHQGPRGPIWYENDETSYGG